MAKPDLVAPGVNIVSSRAPGSTIDAMRPGARLGESGFKGTGTSQATAIVSGIAALMFEARPSLTPDEAKAALVGTVTTDMAGQPCAGAGLVHAGRAVQAAAGGTFQGAGAQVSAQRSSGLGSIDSTRGSHKPYTDLNGDGVAEQVSGEHDTLGNPWQREQWASRPWTAETWAELAVVAVDQRVAGLAGGGVAAGHVARYGLGRVVMDREVVARRRLEPATWTAKSWRDAGWNSFGGVP